MDAQGLWMTKEAALKTSKYGVDFIRSYVWLAHDAASEGKLLYKFRPKMHVFQHEFERLAEWRLNPKTMACFSDEDFVRVSCATATGCGHRGVMTAVVLRVAAAAMASWGP